MELFTTWFLLASIQIAATMSPGPAFAMTMRNSISGTRRDGIMTSIGLGLGVGIYVVFVAMGIAVIIAESQVLYTFVKYAGAAYLIYIGGKAIWESRKHVQDLPEYDQAIKHKGSFHRMKNGFLTNLLNPKALVFFTAVYAQFITPETPWEHVALFCLTTMAIETIWFTLVTLFLTEPRVRSSFTSFKHWLERITGGLLVALGIKLAITR